MSKDQQPINLSSKERKVMRGMRTAAGRTMTELGVPLRVGMVNLDGYAFTAEYIKRFYRRIDALTLKALRRISLPSLPD